MVVSNVLQHLNTNKVLPRKQAYEYLIGNYVPEEKINLKRLSRSLSYLLKSVEVSLKSNNQGAYHGCINISE